MTPHSVRIGDRVIELSNVEKVFFPDAGLTKGDLIDYYGRIADIMLPHLAHRALVMHRFPDGLAGDGFFHKEVPEYFPEWVERITVEKEDGVVTHVVCNDAATLVYLANQACVTPHVWLSRAEHLRRPDRLIVDLDPPDGAFGVVRDTAGACGCCAAKSG